MSRYSHLFEPSSRSRSHLCSGLVMHRSSLCCYLCWFRKIPQAMVRSSRAPAPRNQAVFLPAAGPICLAMLPHLKLPLSMVDATCAAALSTTLIPVPEHSLSAGHAWKPVALMTCIQASRGCHDESRCHLVCSHGCSTLAACP